MRTRQSYFIAAIDCDHPPNDRQVYGGISSLNLFNDARKRKKFLVRQKYSRAIIRHTLSCHCSIVYDSLLFHLDARWRRTEIWRVDSIYLGTCSLALVHALSLSFSQFLHHIYIFFWFSGLKEKATDRITHIQSLFILFPWESPSSHGIESLILFVPEKWNEKVARTRSTPKVGLFEGKGNFSVGEIQPSAACKILSILFLKGATAPLHQGTLRVATWHIHQLSN